MRGQNEPRTILRQDQQYERRRPADPEATLDRLLAAADDPAAFRRLRPRGWWRLDAELHRSTAKRGMAG